MVEEESVVKEVERCFLEFAVAQETALSREVMISGDTNLVVELQGQLNPQRCTYNNSNKRLYYTIY